MAAQRDYIVIAGNSVLGLHRQSGGGPVEAPSARLRGVSALDVERWIGRSRLAPEIVAHAVRLVDEWASDGAVMSLLEYRNVSAWWWLRRDIVMQVRDVLRLHVFCEEYSAANPLDGLVLIGGDGPFREAVEEIGAAHGVSVSQLSDSAWRGRPCRVTPRRWLRSIWSAGSGVRRRRRLVRESRGATPRILFVIPDGFRTALTANDQRARTDVIAGPVVEELRRRRCCTLRVTTPHRERPGGLDPGEAGVPYTSFLPGLLLSPKTWWLLGRELGRFLRLRNDLEKASRKARVEFRGIDLGTFVSRTVAERARKRLLTAILQVEAGRRVLSALDPEAVGLWGEGSGAMRGVLAAAEERRVPTVALQHGYLSREHPDYVYPPYARSHGLLLPSKTCVFGTRFAKTLVRHSIYRDEDIVTTGLGRHDLYRHVDWKSLRTTTRRVLGIPDGDTLVLFTGTLDDRFLAEQLKEVVSSESTVWMLIKLHPTQSESYYAALDTLVDLPRLRVLEEELDLYELMACCDLHIDAVSTALIESRFFDTSAVAVERPSYGVYLPKDWIAADVIPVNDLSRWFRSWRDRSHPSADRRAERCEPLDELFARPARGVAAAQADVFDELMRRRTS